MKDVHQLKQFHQRAMEMVEVLDHILNRKWGLFSLKQERLQVYRRGNFSSWGQTKSGMGCS